MKKVIFLAFMLGLGQWAQAQEVPTKEIVFTATKTASGPIGGISTSTISKKTIEASHQNELEEVLKSIPGVEISSTGGPGGQTSIFMRGADSKTLLVLIDGIMVNDPGQPNRGANIANITLESVERIEVLRGPQSVLYGSNAVSGVINIITKKGSAQPESFIATEGGSYNTTKVYGGTRGQTGALDYSVDFSKIQSSGFSTANKGNPNIDHGGNTQEPDAWKNQSVGFKLGYQLSKNSKFKLTAREILSDKQLDDSGPGFMGDRFDGYPPNPNPRGNKQKHQSSDQLFWSLGLEQKFFNGELDSSLTVKNTRIARGLYDQEGEKTNDFNGTAQDVSWQGSFFFGYSQQLTLGLGQLNEGLTQNSYSSGQATEDVQQTVSTTSFWAQDQYWNGPLEVIFGVRQDEHEKFGKVQTYRLAPSYLFLNSGTKLKASYGTGFRSPSLYELYGTYTSFGTLVTLGNENLTPEISTGWDVGLEQEMGKFQLSATYFQMDFTDRIEFVYNPATFVGAYQNTQGATQTKGTEVELTGQPAEGWVMGINLNQTLTADPNGEPLVRRPKQAIKATGDWNPIPKLKFHAAWRGIGKRKAWTGAYDKEGNQVAYLNAYQVINLAVSWRFSSMLELYGRIDNLADTNYEEAWSYATGGRIAMIGGKASF